MRRISADEAQARLDALIDDAAREPVQIERGGRVVAVVLSPLQFARLSGQGAAMPRPQLERLMERSVERHGGVYRALAEWEAKHEPPESDTN